MENLIFLFFSYEMNLEDKYFLRVIKVKLLNDDVWSKPTYFFLFIDILRACSNWMLFPSYRIAISWWNQLSGQGQILGFW